MKNSSTPADVLPHKPVFRNPGDIPEYDTIEVIEVAQVHENADDGNNDSVVTIDECVPDPEDLNNTLNSCVLTNQL